MTTPNDVLPPARSPLQHLHETAPASNVTPAEARARLTHCALLDLSALPRVGFRGAQAGDYLRERGYRLPERPNLALAQDDGSWAARLSATEYLLLGSLADAGARIAAEETAWRQGARACYLQPRHDSHAWLTLSGHRAPAVMAKLCGVDLSPAAFPTGRVAQTSVARLNAIVVNVGDDGMTRFHLLFDSASACYLWPVLLDAMQEFEGESLGAEALLGFVRKVDER
ncbi:sarcosine oxidase subunit gamma [Billgrantia endophytica]|uniref:Sarcosine oxidase n=1 Tax=Billgrantia endophytica TaxID=2033802 RepID=A0A2N7TZP3_9GAMM|nr:sarcosine oxidase [Halomonas endophytica]PMR73654.1 sarcosine oxidase [Halomonas endophytica]